MGCNCDTHGGGWCYYWLTGIEQCRAEHHEMCNAYTSGGDTGTAIGHPAYREMFHHLIGIPALEVFYNHDLDKVKPTKAQKCYHTLSGWSNFI